MLEPLRKPVVRKATRCPRTQTTPNVSALQCRDQRQPGSHCHRDTEKLRGAHLGYFLNMKSHINLADNGYDQNLQNPEGTCECEQDVISLAAPISRTPLNSGGRTKTKHYYMADTRRNHRQPQGVVSDKSINTRHTCLGSTVRDNSRLAKPKSV